MKQNDKMPQEASDAGTQINHINKVEKSPKSQESEQQRIIDQEVNSEPLKDMHLESGEKINDYQV